MDQINLGWRSYSGHQFSHEKYSEENLVRISARYKTSYQAFTTSGDKINCHLSGKLLHSAIAETELPAVGDWCLIGETFTDQSYETAAQIVELLPRRSKLSRLSAGIKANEQVLAANVDLVFVVTSATRDLNANRLKRYLMLAKHGNATPIMVLSKFDLISHDQSVVAELQREFSDIEIMATSSLTNAGIDAIEKALAIGVTAVFVGSSGVGKSTLVNTLTGRDVQKTKAISATLQKGRHTTSASQLFFIESGGMIIDTPGLREVGLIADEEDIDLLPPAMTTFAAECRFRDCRHGSEPGCAVQAALDDGAMVQDDYDMYVKLEKEAAYNRRKIDARFDKEERKRWKKITMDNRNRSRQRY